MGLFFTKSIQEDLYRYEGNKCKSIFIKLKYLFCVPGFTYVFFFRHASQSHYKFAHFFWGVCLHITKLITHIQIPARTSIGRGFRIVHFGHIVVNPGVIIGKNFNISQGCLIGHAEGKRRGSPVIGDNVCMNANAVIIGNAKIGNNVLIAPGALVNFDVPDNSIVIGNPGKVIQRDSSPTAKYIVYPVID